MIASLGLVGCFYVDPINQRPSLDIRRNPAYCIPSAGSNGASCPAPTRIDQAGNCPAGCEPEPLRESFRGEDVSFTAVVVDPDDHGVDVTWRVYLCTDATSFQDCDAEAALVGDQRTFGFTIPMTRNDGTTPVAGLRIVLDGKDDHGATAKPTDQLQLPVLDRAPDLELRKTSVYEQPGPQYVVGMPINLYALYGDGDDSLDSLAVDWKVYAPMQVPIDLTDDTIDSPPGKRQVAKILRPQLPGEWTVEVTVTDPGMNAVMRSLTFNVVADRAPCISVVAPIVPPASTTLPVMEPTLFQVPIVSDDLDSYPRTVGGSLFGEATFVWSVLGPTGGRQIISGATGASTLFDPSVYAPGTIVELRVEIADRKLSPVNCADGEATCSIGANSCIQRQTWRVEAR